MCRLSDPSQIIFLLVIPRNTEPMPRTTLVLSISSDPEDARRVDQAAERVGLSRSQFFNRAALRMCDEIEAQNKSRKRKPNASELIAGHATSGQSQLAALQTIAESYRGSK
jgi:uncharacterized protein (DUF1778 family)